MAEIRVKHFRRSGAGSGGKELVAEVVLEESDTGKFLQRMERSRLERPCFQSIDMRGRVAGECRHYTFNDRVHYLDDISLQMFEQGLRDNRGVYTVGTFEAIISGPHTLQVQSETQGAAQHRHEEVEYRRQQRTRLAAIERSAADNSEQNSQPEHEFPVEPLENPQQVLLGYFRRRTQPRLQYVGSVTIQCGNIKTVAVSKDISASGVQLRIQGLSPVHAGQEVTVSFDALGKEAGAPEMQHLAYKVAGCEQRETETLMRLQLKNPERLKNFSSFIESFIEQYQQKYKLDIEDEYQSALSWYYERCYAQSVSQVPVFIEQTDSGDMRVQAVAMSEGNKHLVRFFCTDEDNYNFTPLCLPGRLERLQKGQSFLLAMYRQRGEHDQCMRIHSVTDYECTGQGDFTRFVRYATARAEHCVVKVSPGSVPVLSVPDSKTDEVSQRLQSRSEQQTGELRDRMRRLKLVACMVELPRQLHDFPAGNQSHDADAGLHAWVGSECRDVQTRQVKHKLMLNPADLHPELIRFGYVERRREDRYLAETRVEVRIGAKCYTGMSRDISMRGMRIQLDGDIEIRIGVSVKIGLITLQRKKSSTDLMNIPYRVVNSVRQDGATLLMLERLPDNPREGLKEFFIELISMNRHKLGVDVGDIRSAAASRVYEALLASNTPSLPFFIGRSREGGAHLQFVGMPQNRNSLTEYFYTASGYDLRPLNEQRFITAIYDAVQILSRQNQESGHRPLPFELVAWVYKEFDGPGGETFIHMATELDFPNEAAREAFETRLPTRADWRCLKVVSTFTTPLAEETFDRMIETVLLQSRHRAIRLSEMAHSLAGYGELIDITDEWKSFRAARA